VEQGKGHHLTFCAGDALAVDMDRMTWPRWSPPILDYLRIASSPFFWDYRRRFIRLIPYPWTNKQSQNRPFHIDGKRESSVCTEIVLCGVNSGHICQHICIRVMPSTMHVHGCPLRLSAHIKLASDKSRTPARNKRSNTLRSYPFPCHVLARHCVARGLTCTLRS
jgi:hypothetical protein